MYTYDRIYQSLVRDIARELSDARAIVARSRTLHAPSDTLLALISATSKIRALTNHLSACYRDARHALDALGSDPSAAELITDAHRSAARTGAQVDRYARAARAAAGVL